MRSLFRVLAPAGGLAAALACPLPAQGVTWFAAALDGAQEVPPVATGATGWGIVRLEQPANAVRIFVFHEPLSGPPSAAHLHQGAVGVSGGIAVPLSPAGTNTWTGGGTLSGPQLTALLAGNTYLNVHTSMNPGGEIRGQVVPATSTRFTGVLEGSQQVPPVVTAATGTVVAFLHEPENRLVYVVESTGLVNVIAAHVHVGAAGVNGGIIVPLVGSNGSYCGVSDRLTAADVTALHADGMYVNIHTNSNPGGEIRAQLLRDRGDHFAAAMSGAQEVPPVPTNGTGNACLTIDAGGTITVTGGFANLTGAVSMAHVHIGAPGVSGGIVFPLTVTGGPNSGTLAGSFNPSPTNLMDLRAGNWYVNVHSSTAPGGEIRGQLEPAELPTTYGGGCPGGSGVAPQIGATGFPCLAGSSSFDLYGAQNGTLAALALGLGREASGPVPLPAPLTLVGVNAPGCFVLLDPLGSSIAFTDAVGCARIPIAIPFSPQLRGARFYGQWFVFDNAAMGGLATSNGLSVVVQ